MRGSPVTDASNKVQWEINCNNAVTNSCLNKYQSLQLRGTNSILQIVGASIIPPVAVSTRY